MRPSDSTVFQLAEGFSRTDPLKTDVFREQVRYSATWRGPLERARAEVATGAAVRHHMIGRWLPRRTLAPDHSVCASPPARVGRRHRPPVSLPAAMNGV